jgi:hypothetical protein
MKILHALAVAAGLMTAACTPAKAAETLEISRDLGGIVVDYVKRYSNLRDAGGKIIIDGKCASACTMFLGIIPADRVCATKDASLGFHSASRLEGKRRVHAVEFSALMWGLYPQVVRDRLTKLGWLGDDATIPHPNMIWIDGKDLNRFVRPCIVDIP